MANDREVYILKKIQTEKRVKVAELAEELQVTPETIRKDLTELEERRLLKRVHGGAVVPSYFKSSEPAYDDRSEMQIAAKRRIAAEVANDILPGETLLIDNGSTIYELAKAISSIPQLTIITPSLKIAMLFLKNPSAKVFLLGGWLRFTEPSTFGDVTINQLKGFHVNKTILSVAGLSAEYGLTEYLEEDAAIKRQALQCGEKKIVLIDQTKLDVTALLTVAPIEQVDQIYVDGCDTDPRICAIREKGIHVITFKNKVQLASNPAYAEYISTVLNPIREKSLTRAALETLAIIAYKQPITKLEIEDIRRVNCDYAVQVLSDQNMIEVVGRKDAVGKPLLFGTTENFLKRFNLNDLAELPDYDSLLERIRVIEEDEMPKSDSLYNEFSLPEEEVPDFLKEEAGVENVSGDDAIA